MPSSPTLRGRKPRLVDRRGAFHQSQGVFRLRRHVPVAAHALDASDWYHNLLGSSTWLLVTAMIAFYAVVVLIFAGFFTAISHECGLNITSFGDAFLLSAETISTIGYGIPDAYLNHCPAGPAVVFAATAAGIIVDALAIGIIFARFSRGTRRASTVLFSRTGVLRCIRGRWYFMLQVCEMRYKALIEAHVRLYAIRRTPQSVIGPTLATASVSSMEDVESPQLIALQTHGMRLQHPNVRWVSSRKTKKTQKSRPEKRCKGSKRGGWVIVTA